ncbi:ATP-dependent DNA ligase [Cohnella boryungensis]|uniref:ATP-dependent DNA ligase n=2 Tax=Cohnella boryungensis TaxID=768479 RepID=A0ABV8SFR5_9BACL
MTERGKRSMYLAPMLPVAGSAPFDDKRYIFEPRIDGQRLLLSMQNGLVHLFTRHGNEIAPRYPELHRVPIDDNSDVLLDGVVTCLNRDTGMTDYEALLDRSKCIKPMHIQEGVRQSPVHYFVFDILRYRGKDVRGKTLTERKTLLHKALTGNRYFSFIPGLPDHGVALYRALTAKGFGGIVAKRKSSPYVSRADDNWRSIVHYNYAIVQIAGYRKNQFGWLLKHRERIVGLLDGDVPSAYRNAFLGVSSILKLNEDRDYVYVRPDIEARVRFRRWTREGRLYAPELIDFVAP